ncbi:ParB N-terminal domain-containing protein [Tumebacillus permanentifrigoris]|uniref:ParB-like nuclease family protein n=1 Tax=Tumebacillus permanentifrigoris TaxID=378543 RepID=A0A316DC51_9BACL|nr:ParB N-terminal domain-containing protein [Tumebacillus permanentifrigoris]PWK15717.1 ParB-like nuclease family protein [Tumebacillus permanentifrigoris]
MILATGVNSLQVVDLDRIRFHEEYEPHRLDVTSYAIRMEGVLRHPPIAMQMRDGSYLILDGAHRTHSLEALNCKRAVLQVVNAEQFALESWSHAVPSGGWLEELRQAPEIEWREEPGADVALAEVVEEGGVRSFLYPAGGRRDLESRLHAWTIIVDSYTKKLPVQRFSQCDGVPQAGRVHFCYPAWSIEELEETVLRERVMPAGVTRCVVEGRILNLRIPLDLLLQSQLDVERWEQLMEQWGRSLRLYTESVFLCE